MTGADKLAFLKRNYQIIYSLVLIVFIPSAIIANTIYITGSFRANADKILHNKALAISDAFNANVFNILNDQTALQERVEKMAGFNKEIKRLDVLARADDGFKTIASLDPKKIGEAADNLQNAIVWQENYPVAALAYGADGVERQWEIIAPLKNADGKKEALLGLTVSLVEMDALTKNILIRSYIILSITILIIVLLLANNLRLFEYAALYRKIKEVDQMKDEFISIASHELRTPVTGLKGYISLLLDGTFGEISEKARKNIVLMQGATDRLAALVEDLLNVSRIEQGRFKVELKPVKVEETVGNITEEMRIQAENKKLYLKFSPTPTGSYLIKADADRLKQVFVNLIGNAIKYTEKGGVEITAVEKNGFLEIRIKDTGIGMSAKDRERLFEKFYRVQNEKTANIVGTGLGLWITKEIIEMMKGEIMIDSMEGVGTQATVIFPLAK